MRKHITCPLEIKSISDTGSFEGYGAVFGNIDSYGDIITRGAFQKSLAAMKPSNCKMLWQHDTEKPIGVYTDIREDDNGLYVKGNLLISDVAQAREAYALLKANAIEGLSIGYTVNPGGQKMGADGNTYLNDLKLWEVSIVTFPANPEANVESVKSIKSIKDYERFLRDAGFSKKQAVALSLHGFKSFARSDSVVPDESLLSALNQLNESIKGIKL